MSRHVIIRGLAERLAAESADRQAATLAASTPAELPATESVIAERGRTDLSEDRLREFQALARDFLHALDLYEETRDPVVRRVTDTLKKQFRAEVGWLAADFAEADARAAELPGAAEGGGL